MNCTETALSYLRTGLCPLPVKLDTKRPALQRWKPFQQCRPNESQIQAWFADCEGICLVMGSVAGHQEAMDFDNAGEMYQPWHSAIEARAPDLLTKLVVERTPSNGRHVCYRVECEVPGSTKLAERILPAPDTEKVTINGKSYTPRKAGDQFEVTLTLIETRGEKSIIVCAPTPGYVLEQGSFENLPTITAAEREILIETACMLNERIPTPKAIPAVASAVEGRPGDDFNQRGDVRDLLIKHGWTLVRQGENEYWRRPGKDEGWSATLKNGVFYVFTTSAAPFEGNTAYAPFSVYTLLEHNGNFGQAATALRLQGYGQNGPNTAGVDISALLPHPTESEPEEPPGPSNPGPLPENLLRVPGFISEVMDHCLATAPYPNHVMAFAGALALQAFLAGRRVRDPGDNRTNLYLLGLAHSSAGKDWPRKVNTRILHQVCLSTGLGERFASGEGIQDTLFEQPCMLYQTDEIDGLLQSINKSKDARHENILGTLLTMYSSANSIFPMRSKARQNNQGPAGVINQPCLVIFGTAIPKHYYEALSERMLTNGFFARMIILESGPRPKGQDAAIRDLPARVLETARWWSDFQPGFGNLSDWHPDPLIVQQTDDAKRILSATRESAETEYSKAEANCDSVGTTVWGRVNEQARKLALIYAVSANHEMPSIDAAAATWATGLIMHQTRRMLFMANEHVSDNPFHAECLKVIRKLREATGHQLPHSVLLKRMKMDAKSFGELITTLQQSGDVEIRTLATDGRPHRSYRLCNPGKAV